MLKQQEKKREIIDVVARLLSSRKFFYITIVFFVFQAAWIALSGLYPMAFDENTHLGIIRIYANHLSPFWSRQPEGTVVLGAITRDPSYFYHYIMSFPYRLIDDVFRTEMSQVLVLRFISIVFFVCGLLLYRRVLKYSKASDLTVNVVMALLVLTPVVPFLAAQINYDNLIFALCGLIILLTLQISERLNWTYAKSLVPGDNQLEREQSHLKEKRVKVHRKRENCLQPRLVGLGMRELATDPVEQGQIDAKRILLVIIVGLFASIVKYAFLPIFIAVLVWLSFDLKKYGGGAIFRLFVNSFRKIVWPVKTILVILLIIGAGLFTERYGINTLRYHTPTPECDQVLSIEQCLEYGPWRRNYLTHQDKINGKLTVNNASDPISYTLKTWAETMVYKLFFVSNGPASQFWIGNPLPVPLALATGFGIVGVLLALCWQRELRKKYKLGLFGLLTGVYVMVLWGQNYMDFLHIGYPFAIQGRYLLPILPFVYLILVLAMKAQRHTSFALSHCPRSHLNGYKLPSLTQHNYSYASLGLKVFACSVATWHQRLSAKLVRQLKIGLAVTILFILFIQGGGLVTYIVRSDQTWYWPNQTIVNINDTARKILKTFIIGS
ncbi:hypothetical protein HY003_02000 [Candidatus Saccharibacteria bacterium]|nr:hypothetical protein [Candidatus Saccharibacteria bacterium]MBI3338049.1 hypothetical protein [Candidatus Saccharibacteria bacterium]